MGSPGDVGEATSKGLENEQSLIRQPFRRLTYVTDHFPILPASLHLRHRHFIYVTWRAAHAIGARNELFFMIIMANDIRGWMRPKFSRLCLTVENNPRKNLNQEN